MQRAVRGAFRPRLGAGLALLALPAILGVGRPHSPHTELKSSDPAKDTVLAESPGAITLTYTTDVQLPLSSVSVIPSTTDAPEAPAGTLRYLADDRRDVLVLPLAEPLGGGVYTVQWATAGPDGHPISGNFAFRIEPPPEAMPLEGAGDALAEDDSPAPPDEALGEVEEQVGLAESASGFAIGRILDRFALYVGIVALLGAIAFRFLVLAPFARAGESPEVVGTGARRAWVIGGLGLGILVALLPVRLWHQAATFFPNDVPGNVFTVVTGTPWAAGWWVQVVCVVLIGGGLVVGGKSGARSLGWMIVAVGALLLPFTPVLSGHGWADSPRTVSAAATYLHVVAAGGWMGGLACLLFAGIPALREHGGGSEGEAPGIAGMVGAFSRVAQVAVALLLATGALKVWIHIGTVSDLWTTAWGRSLLIKDLIVAGVLLLGLYNWRVVRPRLERNARGDLLKRSATAELILGAAAVVVTSFLVTQPLS